MGTLLEERAAELLQTQANCKQLPGSPALSLALCSVSILARTRLPLVCWRCLLWLLLPPRRMLVSGSAAEPCGLRLAGRLLAAVLLPAGANGFSRIRAGAVSCPEAAQGKLSRYGQPSQRRND